MPRKSPFFTDLTTISSVSSSPERDVNGGIPGNGTYPSHTSPWRIALIMFLADAVYTALIVILIHGVSLLAGYGENPEITDLTLFLSYLIVFNGLVSAWRGLYPGYGVCTIAIIRTTVYSLTGSFAAIIVYTYFLHGAGQVPQTFLIVSYLTLLVTLPIWRMGARRFLSRLASYGTPTVIIGEPSLVRHIALILNENKSIGLKPVAAIVTYSDEGAPLWTEFSNVYEGLERLHEVITRANIKHGIIAMPRCTPAEISRILDVEGNVLEHITVVGEHVPPPVLWISNVYTDPTLSAEIEQRLKQPSLIWKKRLFDLCVSVPMFLIALPLIVIVGVALYMFGGKGPVIYKQTRVGKGGRHFTIYKFRTMHLDADARLHEVLKDPERFLEFNRFFKLSSDPRVTRLGHLLRSTSLDELPQLWNVIRGDMSMVGSRPMLPEQLEKVIHGHHNYWQVYTSTPPGLTGLWQVAVRSTCDFEVKADTDNYYIRNWSLFLDTYLILRTVLVVLRGENN